MNRIFKGVSLTLFTRVILIIIGFVINIIVARLLGPSGKGTIALLNEFFFIASVIIMMGVHEANIYYLGNKQYRHSDIFGNAIYQTLISSLFFIFLFFLSKNWLLSSVLRNVSTNIILIAIWFFPVFFYQTHITTICLGNKNIVGYNILLFIQSACSLAFQLMLIPRFGISGAIYGILLSVSTTAIIGSLILYKYGPPSAFPNFHYWKSSYVYGAKSQIGLILSYFNRRLPIIIINLFLTPTEVGYYAIAITVAELSWYVPESVGTVLFPELSGKSKEDAAKLVAFAMRNTLFITTFIGILLWFGGGIFIKLFFGTAFIPSITLLRILIPGIVIFSINRVLCSYFAGTGRPEYGTYTSIVSFSLLLTLSFSFIPKIGIIGAPIASTIAFIASSTVAITLFIRTSRYSIKEILIAKKEDLERYPIFLNRIARKIVGKN
jgi:O-antigen/teichoic acid export membrane protein